MDVRRIIAEIDAEIEKLQGVRANLAGLSNGITDIATTGRRGRPKGSKNAPKPAAAANAKKTGKRRLSPEGRKAIADAMKRRWAERRKEMAGK